MVIEQIKVVEARPAGWRGLWIGAVVGAVLSVVWSYQFVDDVIGQNVARGLLGADAEQVPLGGVASILSFALATGIAGSFTACNVAVFSTAVPLACSAVDDRASLVRRLAASLGWLAVGATVLAATYGAIAVHLGSSLPQVSKATVGSGLPVKLLQSLVIFGVIGAVMLGLAVRTAQRRGGRELGGAIPTRAGLLMLGALVGAFLIGRPYPLFVRLFQSALAREDSLLGATAFGLQSLGNIAVMGVLMLAVGFLGGSRLRRLAGSPGRIIAWSAGSYAAAGAFLLLYWCVRLPAMFGYGWFPQMPWNVG